MKPSPCRSLFSACALVTLAAAARRRKARRRRLPLRPPALPGPGGVAFYNEVTVDASARGSYFMVCGFDGGYFGIQELGDGKKVLLFSVWDASDKNDPNAVEEEKRVKVLQKDDKVRVGRFGNEGTGAQSFFDYDWKPGETYRFLVTAKVEDGRTAYAAYFYVPEDKDWKRLATLSTIAGGKGLRGYYSFIEDFRRNRVSAGEVRDGPLRQRLGQDEGRPVGGADAGPVHGRLEPGRRTSTRTWTATVFCWPPAATRRTPARRWGRAGPPAGRRCPAGRRDPPFGEGRRLKRGTTMSNDRRSSCGRRP